MASESDPNCPQLAEEGDANSQYINDIKEAFSLVDTKRDGFIETKQLKFAMRALGFEPKKEEINKLVADFDKNKFGKISLDEFTSMMNKRLAEKDANEEISKAFQLFDSDDTGKISFHNLKDVAKQLGENLSDEELREMITEADRDGDGEINKQEFVRIMKKTCLY